MLSPVTLEELEQAFKAPLLEVGRQDMTLDMMCSCWDWWVLVLATLEKLEKAYKTPVLEVSVLHMRFKVGVAGAGRRASKAPVLQVGRAGLCCTSLLVRYCGSLKVPGSCSVRRPMP